ncbi:MAG: hypothetical protein EA397_11130 [Deltaproteobacteria bacterium]|nr:MAG: hypothetical protein EA397_11130 [Deltaproteobacteria bacterium]
MTPLTNRLRRAVPWLLLGFALLLIALALTPDEALARVGGGQTFSTGGSRGGGSSGGGGGEADILFFLIFLAIEYPAIGVPLLLIAVTVFIVRALMTKGRAPSIAPPETDVWRDPLHGQRRDRSGLTELRQRDPGFSMPVLLDYLQLVHRRALEATLTDRWEPLSPFVAKQAREQLKTQHAGVNAIEEVVAGSIEVQSIVRREQRFVLTIVYRGTRLERGSSSKANRHYIEETWTYARKLDARTREPEAVMRLGCPSCGAAIDTDRSGACQACGTPIVEGLLEWRVESTELHFRRKLQPPRLTLSSGAVEDSVYAPTVIQSDLGQQWRAFRARHPGFEPSVFQEKVRSTFLALQTAWSEGRFHDGRPYVTDTLYQTLRFHVEQYKENNLNNRLADIDFIKQEVVKVEVDAWYESITVRIWGSARDWVEDPTGKVVSGNRDIERQFSEYWTFLRAIGSGDQVHAADRCPSCGAPLDNVSQAGVCGYCDSKITTGKFDWVLSRIDQPQVYKG